MGKKQMLLNMLTGELKIKPKEKARLAKAERKAYGKLTHAGNKAVGAARKAEKAGRVPAQFGGGTQLDESITRRAYTKFSKAQFNYSNAVNKRRRGQTGRKNSIGVEKHPNINVGAQYHQNIEWKVDTKPKKY